MKTRFLNLLTLLFVLVSVEVSAQDIQWYGESTEMINSLEGRGWEEIGFNRLPPEAEGVVREPVWNLSRQSAGLLLRFTTESEEIHVSYQAGLRLQMPHMPATGVSGVDLYAKDAAGNWLWVRGNYEFGDTISYRFQVDESLSKSAEYYLYFPLYNSISNLNIGVTKGATVDFLPRRQEKPVVIYGTSIAQGACASRAGMAWTNILGRNLDYPIVNLAFSGNGKMEKEVVDLVSEVEAALYILDCLPNLNPEKGANEAEVKGKLRNAVETIRKKHPQVPILLTEHDGYSDGLVYNPRKQVYVLLNKWLKEVFTELQKEGVEGIYMLTKEEIGLGVDDFVDGTHPTDLGMWKYANAYSIKLNEFLNLGK